MPAATQQRTNNGWLEPLERRALAALAARMPSWVTPDFLTTIGFAGALITFGAYVLAGWDAAWLWVASLGFVVNWFGDFAGRIAGALPPDRATEIWIFSR